MGIGRGNSFKSKIVGQYIWYSQGFLLILERYVFLLFPSSDSINGEKCCFAVSLFVGLVNSELRYSQACYLTHTSNVKGEVAFDLQASFFGCNVSGYNRLLYTIHCFALA